MSPGMCYDLKVTHAIFLKYECLVIIIVKKTRKTILLQLLDHLKVYDVKENIFKTINIY